jgi:hypothetical protein
MDRQWDNDEHLPPLLVALDLHQVGVLGGTVAVLLREFEP